MSTENKFRGSLFATDFLNYSITRLSDWAALSDSYIDTLFHHLRANYISFPRTQGPNESQTETDLIWPILEALGWTSSLRQQNLTPYGRDYVPDGLLFLDEDAKRKANQCSDEWRRYEHGRVIVESKRWERPLDRSSGQRGEDTAPSTQMLRYLRRVDDLTTGQLRWGILTNGSQFRLYYQGARSVSEQFFEIDLVALMNLDEGEHDNQNAPSDRCRYWLRVFVLVFRKEAFQSTPSDERTFHQRALEEGKFYEERVAANLSTIVFDYVFPTLASAMAAQAPDVSLDEIRDSALMLLYRLLFIFYAEDRDLLPVRDNRYDDYGLRERVRGDVGRRKDSRDVFSKNASRYWSAIDDLCRAIDKGDPSICLPPYNGGLFDRDRSPLLNRIRLGDTVMADIVDALSFEQTSLGRKYINYRDLSVQQLGSIYECLLEHELTSKNDQIEVQANVFARKGSGSYYTPDQLVDVILHETIQPLVRECMKEFEDHAETLKASMGDETERLAELRRVDPAERLLSLRVCDFSMGSAHFLVRLVDYLADQVILAMAEVEASVGWETYASPVTQKIEQTRATILRKANESDWIVDEDQLDDRHMVRRMVLKRCVYGVDKNPMAVELAKVSLWLHTFTVGAPLSFLDHHLQCGDSLFGAWVRKGIDRAESYGSPLLLQESVNEATRAAEDVATIEKLSDAEIAEAHLSSETFERVKDATAPLNAFLELGHAFEWLDLNGKEDRAALVAFFDGQFGDPIDIAVGKRKPDRSAARVDAIEDILSQARALIDEERFFNWQVRFPGVWSDWQDTELNGGFDAVIGNPPWDRMKLQEVEWFAARRAEIALCTRASDRKRKIAELGEKGDVLAADFVKAAARAEAGVRIARSGGDYPLLSGGDINLYSLFVERAMNLVKPSGMVGLLTPSGIASDKTAASFFKGIATKGRLKALYDFENRRTRFNAPPFFPAVDSRFKFCAIAFSPHATSGPAQCAFFLQDVSELEDPERRFSLTADDFARVNPNTGTAPIFRTRKDARITSEVYSRAPVLVDRSNETEARAWPVKYATMFHMTNDSALFRTRRELEEHEGAYPLSANRWRSRQGDWLPLYEGKMAQAYDHRAASILVKPDNRHRPAQQIVTSPTQHADPDWFPEPQYWVLAEKCKNPELTSWVLGFKEITAPTNERTVISALFPAVAFGNKIPLLLPTLEHRDEFLLCANFNSVVFDFIARQKVQGQTINLFILEQLPVIPYDQYRTTKFGSQEVEGLVRSIVLELTYTAHDMAPFAREMGYVDSDGRTCPPFSWSEERRLYLRAKLDAVYFHLYGITSRDDVRYIYSTFPIVERKEISEYGHYRSRDLCLAWMNALSAGDPHAEIRG